VVTLDFDHVDPSTKLMAIGSMATSRCWSAIEAEIAKCVVRCANCHRRRTKSQRAGTRPAPLQFSPARE
jgi:hypothetical protein